MLQHLAHAPPTLWRSSHEALGVERPRQLRDALVTGKCLAAQALVQVALWENA
jgi:hypothetical protein